MSQSEQQQEKQQAKHSNLTYLVCHVDDPFVLDVAATVIDNVCRMFLYVVCCCRRCFTHAAWLSSSSFLSPFLLLMLQLLLVVHFSRHCIIVVVVAFLELQTKDETTESRMTR